MRTLLIFCAVVFSVIIVSLSIKLFTLIRESKVDTAHTFIVSFVYKNDVDIVAISSDQKKLSHLKVRGNGSIADKERESGILPDDRVILQSAFEDPFRTSSYFYDAAWHKKGIQTDLSIYDLFRLALTSKAIPRSSTTSESITTGTNENTIDAYVSKMLEDQNLTQDDKTVSIVNATGVSGLGTEVGRVLTNMGLSVVSVTNGGTKERSELTYFGDKSYTSTRVSSLFSLVPKQETTQGLSDIIITLGKDKSNIFK